MIYKYECKMFPNGLVCGVRFNGGYAEVDSGLYVEQVNALNKSPFVELLTQAPYSFSDAEGVPDRQTLINRLRRKTKAELVALAKREYDYEIDDPVKVTVVEIVEKIADLYFANVR